MVWGLDRIFAYLKVDQISGTAVFATVDPCKRTPLSGSRDSDSELLIGAQERFFC